MPIVQYKHVGRHPSKLSDPPSCQLNLRQTHIVRNHKRAGGRNYNRTDPGSRMTSYSFQPIHPLKRRKGTSAAGKQRHGASLQAQSRMACGERPHGVRHSCQSSPSHMTQHNDGAICDQLALPEPDAAHQFIGRPGVQANQGCGGLYGREQLHRRQLVQQLAAGSTCRLNNVCQQIQLRLTRSKTSMESSLCSTCSCFRLACSFSKESSACKRGQ